MKEINKTAEGCGSYDIIVHIQLEVRCESMKEINKTVEGCGSYDMVLGGTRLYNVWLHPRTVYILDTDLSFKAVFLHQIKFSSAGKIIFFSLSLKE